MPAQPQSWTQHIDLIVPGVLFAFKVLISVISAIGAALCSILVWIGKGFSARIHSIDRKLDSVHDAMLACDGCRTSLRSGRRATAADDEDTLP